MTCGIFITGTDTGVGKTFVSCSLAALLRDLGYRVGVMKPVETGCSQRNGELFPDDAVRLKQASGCDEPMEKICPYRFAEPLAPSIAAERGGERIDIDHLLQVYHEISSAHGPAPPSPRNKAGDYRRNADRASLRTVFHENQSGSRARGSVAVSEVRSLK